MNSSDALAVKNIEKIIERDHFSRWLGIEIMELKEDYCKLKMQIRMEMLNGFGIAHGGITFALADSAFAYACNSDDKISVALDASISFPKSAKEGDILVAEARLISKTNRTGLYLIEVRNPKYELVALFKGTCYRTNKYLS